MLLAKDVVLADDLLVEFIVTLARHTRALTCHISHDIVIVIPQHTRVHLHMPIRAHNEASPVTCDGVSTKTGIVIQKPVYRDDHD